MNELMRAVFRVAASLLVVLTLGGTLRAEGLLYQLPEDGSWAKFDLVGKAVEPDGKETSLSGTLTLSSVGTVDVEGQKCRWIELAVEASRNDQMFTDVEKLLIPEKYLVKGEDPLSHVLKAWHKHSMIAGGAPQELQDVQNPDSPAGKQMRGTKLRPFLHGPFEMHRLLPKALVESKLGSRECLGVSAEEKIEGGVTANSKYVIRLHKDAPFGVVTWDAEMNLERDGMALAKMTTTATLSDFGKDAKSVIPEAR